MSGVSSSPFVEPAEGIPRAAAGPASAHDTSAATERVLVDLTLHHAGPEPTSRVPVTIGVCLPRGACRDPRLLRLHSANCTSEAVVDPLQTEVTAHWSDGSVHWVLLDFLAPRLVPGRNRFELRTAHGASPATNSGRLRSTESRAGCDRIDVVRDPASHAVRLACALPDRAPFDLPLALVLAEPDGSSAAVRFGTPVVETDGPVRRCVRLDGTLGTRRPLRIRLRVETFAGSGLVRLSAIVHNPDRAQHAGGCWDLGDPGSRLFEALDLCLGPSGSGVDEPRSDVRSVPLAWRFDPDESWCAARGTGLALYQDSSGGEHWNSTNHVNRDGRVPCRFRGWQAETPAGAQSGERASPTVRVPCGTGLRLAVAVPEFWQQFPKSLHAGAEQVVVGLFPAEWDDLHELQGGERKTHVVWLDVARDDDADSAARLDFVHRPVRVTWALRDADPACIWPWLPSATAPPDDRFEAYLAEALRTGRDVVARREAIDEYGWRNFGDVWADHEQALFAGPGRIVSHYNNQYDVLFGALVQALRTGDPAWFELADPLARHVLDIDLYRTDADRAAYAGGLFWHTDHGMDAATSTHRTYSRANGAGGDYGGGPSNEHVYTTGLLHWYRLTGDREARDAVLLLADRVQRMEEGRSTLFGLFDAGPTGLATATVDPDFHGPGRGAANSINALLDAWLATGDRTRLEFAESLIRRTIHPADDFDALGLADSEHRWSYIVFVGVLARYVRLKDEAGERDAMRSYAAAALRTLGTWMAAHERPFLETPEKLEHPGSTWAAQGIRLANALRMAADFVPEPEASRWREKADAWSERSWNDLARFEDRDVARVLAILLAEGPREQFLRSAPRGTGAGEPSVPPVESFAPRAPFVPQKTRAKRALRTPRGMLRALFVLANPASWPKVWRHLRR